uniref:Lipoprotein n=1 Tax=Solibacter usitatus (strain Ellin6076) TaxID=234267 RepID=Q01P40_SOLUE
MFAYPVLPSVRSITLIATAILTAFPGFCQSAPNNLQPSTTTPAPQENRRIFGIIPNNRSSPTLHPYKPLTVSEKFAMGARDSFDYGAVVLALAAAGIGQAENSNPSFGQGTQGYARYFGTAYGDVVIGNMFTTSIYPSLLHQDPRYFRRATGSTWSRLGYAMSRIFVTQADRGHSQFNYSEFLGNATAVGIANAYYPDNRKLGDNFSRFGIQIGLDMAGNIIKEFGPDLTRKRNHQSKPGGAPKH